MKRKGFTLVELLVVVAIIALLLAILMPQMSAARSMARCAICAHQLRQIGEAFHAKQSQQVGQKAAMRYPDPRRWPTEPYDMAPQEKLYLCPEDDPGDYDISMGLRYLSGLEYNGQRFWIEYQDGFVGPAGKVSCRSRRGVENGLGYTEYVFEEYAPYEYGADFWDRRSWYPSGPDYSDNDGRFRLYDMNNNKRIMKLVYYTCSCDNQVWLWESLLWDLDPSMVGSSIEVTGLYTSYGFNARVRRYQVPADTIVLLDYKNDGQRDMSFIADPDNPNVNTRLQRSARHRGMLNVLFADESVRRMGPTELNPSLNSQPWWP